MAEMADDYLLVPMHLDAMVLNRMADATTPFLRFTMQYHRLAQFQSPEPAPFEGASTEMPAAGIYLHWILPKSLRHGIHKDDGSTEFPPVPNRWLVVRIQSGAPGSAIKAWVLESDYLGPDGTSAFVDLQNGNGDGPPRSTLIGRAVPLRDFVENAPPGPPFLKALAPANAIFSVFSPGVENVFSLFDEMTDDSGASIAKGEFTYHVTGWYSDPSHDPINNQNLEWVLDAEQYRLQWSQATPTTVTKHAFDWFVMASDAKLPKRILTHALLSGICWDRDSDNVPAANYPTDVRNKVRVAVGNTATDALAGIVRLDENNQTEADLFEAFQYDLLEQFNEPGTTEAINMGIREHWFQASSGGTRWTLMAKEQTGTNPRPAAVITDDQARALADLNTKQAELDRQQRILESMQWNLFSLWWKQNWMLVHQDTNSYFEDNDSTIYQWLIKQLAIHTGNPWIFRAGDLTDADGFITAVQAGSDPLSAYLQNVFTPNTWDLIQNYTAPPTPDFVTTLINELNGMLTVSSFYKADSFAQVNLRPDTQQLLSRNLKTAGTPPKQQVVANGIELTHLNRLLLEDGYPQILKSNLRNDCSHPNGTDPSQESWYICKVKAQKNLVDQLTSETRAAFVDASFASSGVTPDAAQRSAAIAAYGSGDAAGREAVQNLIPGAQTLKPVNEEQFFAANDPVVLITGLGRSTNFDPVDGLMCRLPSQTVSALTVSGQTYVTDSSSPQNILKQIPALAGADKVPDAIQQLHLESFLLSPRLFAVDLLGDTVPCPVVSGTPDPQADAVREAFKTLPQSAAGSRFAPVSFAMEEWEQPWVPLVLDWEVTVLRDPAYTPPPVDRKNKNLQLECPFNQDNWQFDGTDYVWIGPTSPGVAGNFNPIVSQMVLSGRTFVTPQLSFRLADQLSDYVAKHRLRDPNLESLLETLDTHLTVFKDQDILSQRLSGLRAMMVQRSFAGTVAPFGDIAAVVGGYGHGHPMPSPNVHYGQDPPVWDFGPMAGTFFVINRLSVIDSFGRTVDLMLANFSANPKIKGNPIPDDNYFYPIGGRNLRPVTAGQQSIAKDPAPGIGPIADATQHMLQLTPRLSQDSQLSFRLLSNDGQDNDNYRVANANPICGWLVPNHLDRSLALYGPDGTAWGELFLSLHPQNKFEPVWQPDPTNADAPKTVADIPNSYARRMIQGLWNRTDAGLGFYDFLQVIDETLWTINPRGQRQDENLSVLIGRPLAIVRAQLSLRLSGLPYYNQDWWDTFQVDFGSLPDDGSVAHQPGAFDGGISNYLWPVRLGSQVLRNDGFIGYFLDDVNNADNTFKVFNTVHQPAEVQTDYLNQIGSNNYLQLRFVNDSVNSLDPKQNQVCRLTMLVDPRATIHAFSGLLPVVTLEVPPEFVGAALSKMRYMFRAGPFLTSPDEVRIPQPAESKGTWTWFDFVANAPVALAKSDDQARLSTTTPLIKEGWLKFTPNSPADED